MTSRFGEGLSQSLKCHHVLEKALPWYRELNFIEITMLAKLPMLLKYHYHHLRQAHFHAVMYHICLYGSNNQLHSTM